MAQVVFENVTKLFDEVVAVNDFTLTIEDGEFLVLVGPSGCGKSTALRMVAGLEEISGGDIYIGDRRINDVAAKDRDIAMVFQTYALYPHMSLFDNMAFGLKLRHVPKEEIRSRVHQAAAILGIEDLLTRKPRQLSGGQRQRVALGRAIVRNPAAFLLDEPLSNLDAKLRVQTRAEISKLHDRLESTFLYVTHDQTEAMTMATRIAVMDLGILQQVGTPRDLYQRPANVFVAGFIGSPAMNLFTATVKAAAETVELQVGPFSCAAPADRAAALRPYLGRQILFGLRPEHIHGADYVPPGVTPAYVDATVEIAELMGNETFLHLQADGTAFLARVDPRVHAPSGQSIRLGFDLSQMHAFDIETRQAVLLTTEAAG